MVLKIDSIEYDTLAKEAQKWNLRHATDSTVSWPAKTDVASEEEPTDEDLLWCGDIHRPVMVLKNAVASRFKKKREHLDDTGKLKAKLPEKIREKERFQKRSAMQL